MTARARNLRRRTSLGVWGCALVALVAGCAPLELPSYYGRHQLPQSPASVNGTDVLAGMFRQSGRDVYFRRTIVTSELESVSTIVWFPDDFAAPRREACEWFENWLYEQPGRTLVYVGRDFNAAPAYFQAMKARVGPEQKRAYDVRELEARVFARMPRDLKTDELTCKWFHFEAGKVAEVSELAGPWSAGIDAAKTGMQVRTRLVPNRRVRRLLTANDELFASRFALDEWDDSRILLVANGSFLLNLPLVNHENRRLAARLIASTAESGDVVFLESGPGGPPIDPESTDNSLWTLLGAWPLNVVLLQLAVAGVIFCFARWPIFGRPHQPAAESTSDFARHVEAIGQLLSKTKDRGFALTRARPAEEAGAHPPGSGRPAARSNRKGRHRQ